MARPLSFPRHRKLLATAVLAVVAAHLGLGQWLARSVIGTGAADKLPAPIEVAFVRELAPAAPPVAAATARPLPTRPQNAPDLRVPSPAAVPELPESPESPDSPMQPQPAPSPDPAELPESQTPPLQPPGGNAFDWPPATRLMYTLTGHYRGPLHGSGQVDWLREDTHYQVRVTVDVSPAFTRRLVSDGEITPLGLSPRRYDEETEVTLLPTRTHTLRFSGRQVQLSSGEMALAPEGVQDAASQFVQMTWLFLTDPQRLAVGEAISLPLALPRRVGNWTYDVTEHGPLALPFGPLDAYHLVPRLDSARPGEFTAELWVAPSLQYLPVRILIRQDKETWLDLQLRDKPLQAEMPAAPASGTLPELRQRPPPSNETVAR